MRKFKQGKPLYDTWKTMIRRCADRSFKDWNIYGGKGIEVCERWLNYDHFVADVLEHMGPRPSPRHTIDRINGNRGYEPWNCRWATPVQQGRNTARNVFFEHDDLRLTLSAWAEKIGMKYLTLYTRLFHAKMPFAEAINTPVGMPTSHKGRVNSISKLITFEGRTMAMIDWASHLGIKYGTLKSRIKRGMDPAVALARPVGRHL